MNIFVESDSAVEGLEEFEIQLDEDDPQVMIDRDKAIIQIIDEDGIIIRMCECSIIYRLTLSDCIVVYSGNLII